MVGRKKETEILNRLYNSSKAQFVAVYGRRRVGKTYLVNEVFEGKITFRHAGLSPIDSGEESSDSPIRKQLKHFYNSLVLQGMKKSRCPENWMDAFLMLEMYLQEKDDGTRQLIFIDELPWLDTPKSGFITAFEGFWNTWACSRKNVMLVVCGSATSWMTDKLINNHGGLYNRLTCEIKLSPFSLGECEQYLLSENIKLSRYDIVQSYMITGGIPYYLSYFRSGLSLAQNVDSLFFSKNAPLNGEFNRLFRAIFNNPDMMIAIIRAVGSKHYGCTRSELAKISGISEGGTLTNALAALIASDFIIKYIPFGCSKREDYYKLTDSFCNFYLRFVENEKKLNNDFWITNIQSQEIITWRGIAFENVCFNHIEQIKKALGISGVSTNQSAWSKRKTEETGTQIDLIIERKDNIVNMCEIKFYGEEFTVNKNYDRTIRNRISLLSEEISPRTAIHSTLITTFGLKYNEYSGAFVNVVDMDDLFEQ
ncbi:MAG: ATP-binding protein [Parasporobacterium sp.]|nr:ATP-binding protein [Parasporobacterium sp.]